MLSVDPSPQQYCRQRCDEIEEQRRKTRRVPETANPTNNDGTMRNTLVFSHAVAHLTLSQCSDALIHSSNAKWVPHSPHHRTNAHHRTKGCST
jgi:hypothetical protein